MAKSRWRSLPSPCRHSPTRARTRPGRCRWSSCHGMRPPPSSGRGGGAWSDDRGLAGRHATGMAVSPGLFPHRAVRWHRPLILFSAAMVALAVVAAVGLVVDDRVLVGAPIWLKPLKFATSFAVYSATLAWMLSLLPRPSRIAHWAATIIVITGVIEMVVIVGQVIRGRQSHFNQLTPLDARLYDLMAGSIAVLWLGHLAVAGVLARRPLGDPAVRTAIRLGLVVSVVGMAATGVPMTLPRGEQIARNTGFVGAHSVGVADGGPGLPVTGWSTTGGDLRIGHFVGLHSLQVLPFVGWLLMRRGATRRLRGGQRGAVVWVAAFSY